MERVQFQQEQMLPELRDWVEKGLFTQKEIKQIMKKRTEFESALIRRVARKADFLRYLAYEAGLEELRKKRAQRLDIPDEYTLVKRQFQILERAVKKFKSDVGLWIEYIQHAKRLGAHSVTSRVSARAVQLHPTTPSLYILAAAHELDQQSPASARSLLQRGLRINPDSEDLWREYLKMELSFLQSVRQRWTLLGIEEDNAVLKGDILRSILTNAPKHILPSLKLLISTCPLQDSIRQTLLSTSGLLFGQIPTRPHGSPPDSNFSSSLSSSPLLRPLQRLEVYMVHFKEIPVVRRRNGGLSSSQKSPRSPYLSSTRQLDSFDDPFSNDILLPGDIVGERSILKGEQLNLVYQSSFQPAKHFEVLKELGKGSYAVVYLVQEVFNNNNGPFDVLPTNATLGHMDDVDPPTTTPSYGRKFAIKCLSKANLDQEELALQMTEVTIHQSLPLHPNIVALHQTLETSAYLLLLLEYVPGEDLFYFLEQSRDHFDPTADNGTNNKQGLPCTPPTPSLLSTLHPSFILSRTRLRLIASMFGQMCDAVAACHAQGVFHRDIKPENFIVTDGTCLGERKVLVKLTDFGLSTTDEESSDMDCGSAPYMSYECRNNITPTYRPRAADVWSLGIVLINMLYHINPWTDPAYGACPAFSLFRQDPIAFFMHHQRFTGMTPPVAKILATRVFCLLHDDDGDDASLRMSADELGKWVRANLVDMLAPPPSLVVAPVTVGHKRTSGSAIMGHKLSALGSLRISHRPSSRPPSVYSPSPVVVARTLSLGPSPLTPASENEEFMDEEREGGGNLSSAPGGGEGRGMADDVDMLDLESEVSSRSPSRTWATKRRRRGLRRGKAALAAAAAGDADNSNTSLVHPRDETLNTLAAASQSLAREISNASKPHSIVQHQPSLATLNGNNRASSPSPTTTTSATTISSSSLRTSTTSFSSKRGTTYLMPSVLMSTHVHPFPPSLPPRSSSGPMPTTPTAASTTTTALAVPASVAKKPSKWRLSFGKNSGANAAATLNNTVTAASDSTTSSLNAVTASTSASSVGRNSPVQEISPSIVPPPPTTIDTPSGPLPISTMNAMSTTATNVTNVIMGLDPPSPSSSGSNNRTNRTNNNSSSPSALSHTNVKGSTTPWSRGRRGKGNDTKSLSGGGGGGGGGGVVIYQHPSRRHQQYPSFSLSSGSDMWSVADTSSSYNNNNNTSSASNAMNRRGVASGFGAAGGRHGSIAAAGGPFASIMINASSIAASNPSLPHNSNANWRNSMSTASTSMSMMSSPNSPSGSTSAFTSYSNSSARSVATTATSVSDSMSWRTGSKPTGASGLARVGGPYGKTVDASIPKPVKIMDEVPSALNELPRGQNPDFGTPSVRKARTRNKKSNNNNGGGNSGGSVNGKDPSSKLDTINEQRLFLGSSSVDGSNSTVVGGNFTPPPAATSNVNNHQKEGGLQWRDASTSTTDLVAANPSIASGTSGSKEDMDVGGGAGPPVKKVQKGQINALAKMLSALRR